MFDGIVIDYSYAEMFAILDVFNGMDFIEYLNKCYNNMNSDHSEEFSMRYVKIYLCCSHISKNMADDIHSFFQPSSEVAVILKEIFSCFIIIKDYNIITSIWRDIVIILMLKFVTKKLQMHWKI